MEILEIIQQNKEELQQRFGIQRIGLVLTQGRGEQEDTSRVNLLIEFGEITTDVFLEFKSYLEQLFGKDVDLAISEESHPHLPSLKGEIQWSD